ncbi:MAG TPA: MmgE/PrpD family protein [Acidimicrobiales bacterium]|nr:MmgE/PrpD family protein [Acidimicrobiales bacterium]
MSDEITRPLARWAAGIRFEAVPDDVVEIASQCILDWLAVTLAGSAEPAARIALAVALDDEAGDRGATVVGTPTRLSPPAAAIVNGTASHALDYDDANAAMIGHPTVPVLGALLPLAEVRHASGRDVLEAFVAGYETECRVGRALGSAHYRLGFHATGTVGTIGAATACARLLDLDEAVTAVAIGLAATQAAGLKCMFGTMAKPLHAGKAAANGLLAARLAARGFSADAEAIEAPQGLAATMGGSLNPERAGADRWYLRDNLFKYHASCLETHSTIEGIRALRAQHDLAPQQIDRIVVHANTMQLGMCAIPEPTTGLEAKFSLRHLAAAAALGIDTGATASFADNLVADPKLVALRHRVEVTDDGPPTGGTPVEIHLTGGTRLTAAHDIHQLTTDIAGQRRRLEDKATSLVRPILGDARTTQLIDSAREIAHCDDVADLLALA